ncbi:MAG: chromosomal replication initiator protein DnaA [Thermoplasmatota archaeon]
MAVGILDWLRKGPDKKKKDRSDRSSSDIDEVPQGIRSRDERTVLLELEREKIRNQEQERKIKEMEERFQKMQDNWVSLLEKQQSAIEGFRNSGSDPMKKMPPEDGTEGHGTSEGNTQDHLSSPILEDKSFNNFVVDDSNRFPYLASEAVATGVGRKYNPLFVYGPVGVGKTHLMYAIANKILEDRPDTKLMYSSTERFTDELLKALEKDDLEGFRSRYRELDVLLVDDIQMLSGREATQQEFFHMFNHLYNSGKQIVLSSDRPPMEINELENRLRSRFEGGLIIDIKIPTFEGRRQILVNLSNREGFSLSTEVLDYLAFYLDSSVRELEGGFNRITAYASLMKEPITVSLVRKVLVGFMNRKDEINRRFDATSEDKSREIKELDVEIPDPYSELDLEEETDQIEKDLLMELKKSSDDL